MDYLEELKRRKKESRIYSEHQLIGLEIAEILDDKKHKSLYMKLAKDGDPYNLLKVAKSVAERRGVINKGAYFMQLIKKTDGDIKN